MLYGIIADIHSNWEALEVVLHELRGADQIVCGGDLVGYGPNPNECVEKVKELRILSVAGNHDKAAVGEFSLENFVDHAKEALIWTTQQLTVDNQQYLKSLPLTLEFSDFQVVHGSLRRPLEEYIETFGEAAPTLELMRKPLLFVGHTHKPTYLKHNQRVLVNPGSVGQPRDGDPRASFGIYDSQKKEFTLHRVEYHISAVQEKMRKAGLPLILIARLPLGR